ncbi:MAG: PorT family protein [Muribaculaceae bacterium]|nr:PorT family protein [Muribaculaceae bacterium]MDE6321883.1 PorT family protein [Muribaculaceae bacterium]
MKKIITSIFVAIAMLAAMAPAASAQFRYGATLGADFSTLKFKQDLITIDRCVGPEAGITTEMMFPGIGFGLGSGILYQMKGANLHLGEKKVWEGYGNERAFLHYLHIPVNLKFKWTRMNGLEDYVAPFVYGGPSIGFLLGHSHIPALKYPLADIGLEVGFGVEVLKKWQISAVHNWGVTYCAQTKLLDDFSAKNRSWSVRLVYFFSRKK